MIASGSHLKYARALYKVAEKNGAAERVLADLEELAHLSKDARLGDLLKKIAYMENTRLRQLLAITFKEKIHAITLNALILLASSKKLALLPRVAEAYRQVYHEAKGIHEFRVSSARKLSRDEESQVREKLEKKFKKPASVRFEENPQLIGGMQIFERGYVTDYSLKNYLDYLRQSLMKTELSS